MQGKELKVVNDQFGNPTYAGDLANVIKEVIEKGGIEPGIYHTVDSGLTSWYEFAKLIIEECKINEKWKMENGKCVVTPVTTTDFQTKAKRPKYSVLSTEKLKKPASQCPIGKTDSKDF